MTEAARINLKDLIATQTGIHSDRLAAVRSDPVRADAPIVVAKDPAGVENYVLDGHSRVVHAAEQGKYDINAVLKDSGIGRAQAMMVKDALGTNSFVKVTDLKTHK